MKKIKGLIIVLLSMIFVFMGTTNNIQAFGFPGMGNDPALEQPTSKKVEIERRENIADYQENKAAIVKSSINNIHIDNTNKIKVDTEEKIEFVKSGYTGIKVAFKQRQDYTGFQVGGTVLDKKAFYPVSDFKSSTDKILNKEEIEDGKFYILGQSKDEEIQPNTEHVYKYSYEIDRSENLGFKDKQLFMYAVGQSGTEYKTRYSEYNFYFPKKIEGVSKAEDFNVIYDGKYEREYKEVDGKPVFTIKILDDQNKIPPIIAQELPGDYFKLKNSKYTDYFSYFILLLGTIFSIVVYSVYGKNIEIEIKPKTKPFGGYTSSDMLVLLNEYRAHDPHRMSIILDWYKNGYIDIQPDSGDSCYIIKTKELDGEKRELYPHERDLWNVFFEGREAINLYDLRLPNQFSFVNAYNNLNMITDKVNAYGLKSKLTKKWQYISAIAVSLCNLVFLFINIKQELSIVQFILTQIVIAAIYVFLTANSPVKNNTSIIALGFFIPLIVLSVNYLLYFKTTVNWVDMLVWLVVYGIDTMFIGFTGNYDPAEMKEIGKAEGFRLFIKDATKGQLENLSGQNKQYFEEILPYAYAFGLGENWIEKYRNLSTTSNIDLGYNQLAFYSFLSVIEALDSLHERILESDVEYELDDGSLLTDETKDDIKKGALKVATSRTLWRNIFRHFLG